MIMYVQKRPVRYNGDNIAYFGDTDPQGILTPGKVYTLVAQKDSGFNTSYFLEGVRGRFNSLLFSEVAAPSTKENRYYAESATIPVVGRRLHCLVTGFINGEEVVSNVLTSVVRAIRQVARDKYVCQTTNSVYVVKVV